MSTEVEEGLLADLATDAMGADEAVGEVGLAGMKTAGLGASDEHGKDATRGERGSSQSYMIMALHSPPQPRINNLRVVLG